ncbi:MAG: hypothetical protein Q7T20_17450 [Saprospiraceae bacterium]|nr:hypothetical protein [Saprospiraceae bacterium]
MAILILKKIKLLAIFILLTYSLSAQYELDGSEKWSVRDVGSGWFGDISINDYLFFIDGDTLINNITYRKFYDNRLYTRTNGSGSVIYERDTFYREYYGALRYVEDSLRIVDRWKIDGSEVLIHKFDLSVGDTVKNQYNSYFFICTKIDSVPFGNSFKKRYIWYLDYGIIEGIGFTESGLFPELGLEYSRTPFCFESNSGTYFFNGASDCLPNLHPISSVEGNDLKKISVQLYPNPSPGGFNIDVSNVPGISVQHIHIFDSLGKSVTPSDYSLDYSEKNIRVEMGELKGFFGIYIYSNIGVIIRPILVF